MTLLCKLLSQRCIFEGFFSESWADPQEPSRGTPASQAIPGN